MMGVVSFPNLFRPAQIGKLKLKNCVVMLPMGSTFASPSGLITERTKDHYVRRARGGVGLIIVGNVLVDLPLGRNGFSLPSLDSDRCLPGHYEMVEAIHAQGAKIAAQLNHPGRQTTLEFTGGLTPVSASPVPCRLLGKYPMPTPRALERGEIDHIISLFAAAAPSGSAMTWSRYMALTATSSAPSYRRT